MVGARCHNLNPRCRRWHTGEFSVWYITAALVSLHLWGLLLSAWRKVGSSKAACRRICTRVALEPREALDEAREDWRRLRARLVVDSMFVGCCEAEGGQMAA